MLLDLFELAALSVIAGCSQRNLVQHIVLNKEKGKKE